jgi:hypothetical protein
MLFSDVIISCNIPHPAPLFITVGKVTTGSLMRGIEMEKESILDAEIRQKLVAKGTVASDEFGYEEQYGWTERNSKNL